MAPRSPLRLGACSHLLGGLLLTGCVYVLDSEELDAKAAGDPVEETVEFTVALETPAVELNDGGLASDSCVLTNDQVRAILTRSCASCHAPPGGAGGFRSILDWPTLITALSATATDPVSGNPVRLLVPGEPDQSRLYARLSRGEMPPRLDPALPQLPRPTISDVSVVREWITSCASDAAASD
jgi:hypothetical protein